MWSPCVTTCIGDWSGGRLHANKSVPEKCVGCFYFCTNYHNVCVWILSSARPCIRLIFKIRHRLLEICLVSFKAFVHLYDLRADAIFYLIPLGFFFFFFSFLGWFFHLSLLFCCSSICIIFSVVVQFVPTGMIRVNFNITQIKKLLTIKTELIHQFNVELAAWMIKSSFLIYPAQTTKKNLNQIVLSIGSQPDILNQTDLTRLWSHCTSLGLTPLWDYLIIYNYK